MIENDIGEIIVNKYYDNIYNYCYAQLRDKQAAQDCTQEIFYIFFSKKSKLYVSDKILAWLYKAAKKVIMRYKKANTSHLSLDDINNKIEDKSNYFGDDLISEIYEILDKKDADLFIRYFNADHGERKKLAEELGISVIALYKKIDRLRKKLSGELDKSQFSHN